MLDLRDYLNSWAEPATGASIAFTTLVVRKSPEARKGKADAERAYPEWIQPARGLRRAMVVLLHLAVVITLSIAALAAYIYFGSAKIANIAEINSQFKFAGQGDSPRRGCSQPSAKHHHPALLHRRRDGS